MCMFDGLLLIRAYCNLERWAAVWCSWSTTIKMGEGTLEELFCGNWESKKSGTQVAKSSSSDKCKVSVYLGTR